MKERCVGCRRPVLWTGCFFLVVWSLGRLEAFGLPSLPLADYAVVEAGKYDNADAAREHWRGLSELASVGVAECGERRVLRLECCFSQGEGERAVWDAAVALDLSRARGMSMAVHCADASPIAALVLYLRSGDGWYSAPFSVPSATEWSVVRLDKMQARVEGSPKGWDCIEGVRIAAWRGMTQDTILHVADIGVDAPETSLALLRGDWAAVQTPGEAATVFSVGKRVAGLLDDLGIPFWVFSDASLSAKALKGITTVMLPYAPTLPKSAEQALVAHMKGGGNLISCYTLSNALCEAAGVKKRPPVRVSNKPDEKFATICPEGTVLPGFPKTVTQFPGYVAAVTPLSKEKGSVAAYWYDEAGKKSEEPAVTVTDQLIHFSHVIQGEDLPGKRRMLLAMLGYLEPQCWRLAVLSQVDQCCALVGEADLTAALMEVCQRAQGREKVLAFLEDAQTAAGGMTAALEAASYATAMTAADTACTQLKRAWCCVQPTLPDEFRGFWCHDPLGVQGMTWDEAVARLAENGFTAIFPNLAWGGVAYYESAVLPMAAAVSEQGDQLAACLAACRAQGVECHVWKVCWNMGAATPKSFALTMQKAGRTQVDAKGKARTGWLCPSHPENQQQEIDAMVELATKYGVDGIHFDYIRYPDAGTCYCKGCRERFETILGEPVSSWPGAVLKEGELRTRWLQFRRDQITRVVSEVHRRIREAELTTKISAAVLPRWSQQRDSIAQDWSAWCKAGYLDFVCPMDYTDSTTQFSAWVGQQKTWAGTTPVYPGIGLSVWSKGDRMGHLVAQVLASRAANCGGFMLFNYGVSEASEIVSLCGLGLTRVAREPPAL